MLFFLTVTVQSQEFNKSFILNWQEQTEIRVSKDYSVALNLVEGNVVNEKLIPSFTESWVVDFNTTISNVSLENITFENTTVTFNKSLISEELEYDINIVNERDKTYAIFNLIPFIREGNQVRRVKSVNVKYSLLNKKTNRKKNSTIKNSVLSSGEWFKFSVDTSGVFKIDRNFLQDLGVDISNVDPRNIQIFGNGGTMLPFSNADFVYDGLQENAIFVEGEDDGSFNNSDYILFFAKGPHTWKSANPRNLESYFHETNIYSDESFYFLTIGNSSGKRIQLANSPTSSTTETYTTYHDFKLYEKDEVNLFAIGQQWFGDEFSLENSREYTIPFRNVAVSNNNILVRTRGVAESGLPSSMNVNVNGADLFDINYGANGGLTKAVANQGSGSFQLNSNELSIEISYNNGGNPSANAYLDYIEILGEKELIAEGEQFLFKNINAFNTNGIIQYILKNSENIHQVWNVSNHLNPEVMINESNSSDFSFKIDGGVINEFVVLNEDDYYTPNLLEESNIENQNLHSLYDLDYIVVTTKELATQAQRLADYHQANSNLDTRVIILEHIYNEFSSGSPDITGIRNFVKHLYDNSTNKVKYVCLFGDASYDYKDRISGNNNIVPVFEAFESFNLASSFVTDDYYGMMDDNEGLMYSYERQDVITGRIPVSDPIEANEVVTKVLNYYSNDAYGNWRTNLTLIADDIDSSGEQVLELEMEEIADDIKENQPVFNVKKIYMDAYKQESSAGGNRYPTVKTDIANQVDGGTLLVDYFGHGGEDGWARERILEVSDIQGFSNFNRQPLFITVTCEFARFDNPLRKTAGEYLIWNQNGGASSLISTTRQIFISVGQAINSRLIQPLLNFNNENYTIAESLINAKNQFSTSQRFMIYFFGDPAMRLAVPKPQIKLTTMNGVNTSQRLDTIKALSRISFQGEVQNESGFLLDNFNGEMDVVVYDKIIEKQTLDNDNRNFIMDFDVLESKIFSGRSKVENGKFSFDFVAPKDLKVAFGKGKLSMYANNTSEDRSGYNLDVVVGGVNENAPEDNIGPTVQLYLNDLSFVDGSQTNDSPTFIAVLEDENGINTSITAVDHDIVAIIDNDQSNPIVLNDYYKTELDDFTKGRVEYPFRDLEPGLHTITLKVWDTYNNSSEATLTFVVVNNTDLELSNVLNYPNPFVNYTEFWFNHNKPNELLNVQVQIFTVSGKLVKTLNETVQTSGTLSRSIVWNGLDDFGSKIGKGVYIYKLRVKSMNSNTTTEKTEKLVILQ